MVVMRTGARETTGMTEEGYASASTVACILETFWSWEASYGKRALGSDETTVRYAQFWPCFAGAANERLTCELPWGTLLLQDFFSLYCASGCQSMLCRQTPTA